MTDTIRPIVKFEIRPVEDRQGALQTGRAVRDAEFVVFRQVGDKHTIVEKEITPEEIKSWSDQPHKEHVPALYDRWKQGLEAPVDGTPVKDWPALTPSQLHQALAVGVRSVEDFAALTDEGAREFGIGAQVLKQKAKNWLASQHSHGKVAEQMTDMQAQIQRMQEQMAEQARALAAKDAMIEAQLAMAAESREPKPEPKAEAKPVDKAKK